MPVTFEYKVFKSIPISLAEMALNNAARKAADWVNAQTDIYIESVSQSFIEIEDGKWQAWCTVWYRKATQPNEQGRS